VDLRSAAKFDLDRFRGVGLQPPKLKKIEFYQYNCCTIFTKFISFMRVLSLHNSAKFDCFISINDKIINNLLRWGRFQPNFRRPLAAKLWMGAKTFWTYNDGTNHLYHHAKFRGNRATHVGARG